MSAARETTGEAALEEALAERNRLWDELQRRSADQRELEHWRERALAAESTVAWRATQLLRRALRDPAGFARAVLRRLRRDRRA